MGRGLIAVFFAIMMGASSADAKDDQIIISTMDRIKSRLVRPTITVVPSLGERQGVTSAERDLISKKYPVSMRKSIEETINFFWSVDLLRSLAAAGSLSFESSSESKDDWLHRIDVTDDRMGCGIAAAAKEDRIQLTYLNAYGFKKIEDSKELVGVTGRDLFAGIPVADFCERSPGSRVPVDFALRFSPWDIASQLASSSRLEASLVNLILKPDGLAVDADLSDSSQHHHDKSDYHEHGWMDALDRLDKTIKKGALSLSDLANLTRRDQAIEQSVRSMILAAAVSAPHLRKDCERIKGVWTEVKWAAGDNLELFSCRNKNNEQVGFVFAVEEGDLAEGTITLSTLNGSFRIEAKLDAEADEFSVRYNDPTKSINSEIWFTKEGAVRSVKDIAASGSRHVFFDEKRQLVWSNVLGDDKTVRNVSWYRDGQPRSFQLTDDGGRILGSGGFFPNGRPQYWMPYQGGKKDGKLIWWFSNGKIAGELEYAGGKRFGLGSVFYENGVEGFHGEYSDDQVHGKMLWRDPSGRSLFSMAYVGGKAHGLMEIRHGGRTIAEARFHGGSVEGTVIVRNDRGMIVGEIPYQAGLLDGQVILRDASGAIRVTSNWDEGQLDGETEAWYSSNKKAGYCRFDDGHLLEWGSFRPDSAFRYAGKVNSSKEGRATIEYFAGNPSPGIRCKTEDWIIEECDVFASGKSNPMPRLRDFAKNLSLNQKFRFQPDKCGGYTKAYDVSSFTDVMDGDVQIDFRVKDSCKDLGLATSIRCKASVHAKAWSVQGCESISLTDPDHR